jgi:PAS domain S-box-containing protein
MREPISRVKLVLIGTIFALQCPLLPAQASSGAKVQVGHDFWGYKEGAPEGTEALAQTSDGFLWLATPSGLFRFDGTRFERFRAPFGDKLLSTNIRALFAPASGGLWIGYTFGGFSFLKNGRVKNYAGEASSSGSISVFAQNGDGTLWAATTSGLWRFEDSLWHHLGAEWNAPVPADDVGFDRNGSLWALGEHHLLVLFPGRKQFQIVNKALPAKFFTLDADGKVLTRPTTSQDKSELNGNQLIAYPLFFEKSYGAIVDRMNSVWIAPHHLLVRMPLSDWTSDVLKKSKGAGRETYPSVAPFFLRARLVDREGNLWFGDTKGVHRFFYTTLMREELPNEFEESSYFSVAPDDHGAVWVTAGDNVSPSHLWHVTTGQAELRKLPGSLIAFTYRSPDMTFWLGGTGGLWRLVGGNMVRVEIPKPVSNQIHFLQAITQDRRGGMWVSFGRHGLYRVADGIWTPYGGREDLPKTGAVIEFTDPLGRVWFGFTKNTLAVLDGDRVQVFGPGDGLQVGNVTAIYGRGSEIWIGGEFGLQQFDHGHFHNILATDDDLLRGISGIVETADGDLWLNDLGGILHVRRSEISEALKNSAYPIKGEHFGTREGLPGYPFQLRPLNTAIEGTDGKLWFATNGGVVWIDPAHTTKKVPPTPVTIQSVSADDKNYQLGSELKFPAQTSSVQIGYAAVSLSDPEAIRYRYKLQEADKGWHEVATPIPVSYRNLSPGSYHFSVASTDTNGVWSEDVATTEFTILPAFYQAGWFKAACVLAILGSIYLAYRLRVQQLRRQEGKLRDVIETIPTFAWTALPDGGDDFVNRHWYEYSGLSIEESAGSGWEAAVHPADRNRHVEKWRACLATGEPYESEVRYRRADGQYRWFLVRAVASRDARGKIIKWYGIDTDIEDRKRAEQDREKLRTDLAHVNRVSMMGELAVSLSHELKQPITAGILNANTTVEWLKRNQPNVEMACETAAAMVKAGQRAAEIIDHLRSLYKKAPPRRQVLELNEIIGEIVTLLRGEANLYAVSIRTDLAGELPEVPGDRVQLQQVLMNLMLNAIEAMRETGGVLTVKSRLNDEGRVQISVDDTGPGLPTGNEDQLFEAFFTTKPQGSGMGLAISRSIIKSHGGRLWATVNAGRGAAFHFTLPTTNEGSEAPAA